jgi:hypothetical protein
LRQFSHKFLSKENPVTLSIDWYIEGRVLDLYLSDQLTLDDLLYMRHRIADDFAPNGKPPTIHALINLTDMEAATFTLKEWLDTPNQVKFTPEQVELLDGWRVYYGGDDTAFRFLLSIFHQKSGHRAVWHSTREDALRFLAERDDTLADPIYDLEGF